MPGTFAAGYQWRRDLRSEFSPSQIRKFPQGEAFALTSIAIFYVVCPVHSLRGFRWIHCVIGQVQCRYLEVRMLG